jgi:asparagine synthase (glutamine-hydrolysing)
MAFYGPDGGGSTTEGSVAFGHLLCAINPEDVLEKQPYRGQHSLLVCAARLDNRDSLREQFNLSTIEGSQLSDGHLAGMAFDRWGENFCLHLEGDWALAAWDARNRRLLLARDVFGGSALYYYLGKGYLAFATSLKALLALPGIVKEPDLLRLAEALVSWRNDPELTAYKGFRSLVGAHVMTVLPDGQIRDRVYWSADGREPLRYRREEEYVEAFLEHYARAVQNCLRTQHPIAAELSGGRDSGSIVTLAAPILAGRGCDLRAYTYVPFLSPDGADENFEGNEWGQAHATAIMAGRNVHHVPIDARNYSVLEGVEYFLDIHDGPIHVASNHYWAKAILNATTQSGCRVLLSGGMGNATVSWRGNGSALLALLHGNPSAALRLLLLAEPNTWLTLKRQVLKPLIVPPLQAIRRLKTPAKQVWREYSALNVQLAEELKLDERMREAGYDPSFAVSLFTDVRTSHLLRPECGTEACLQSEVGARHSLQCLDPTADLSLTNFLLSVPDDQFYRRGEFSWLIKRAFHARMPHSVLYPKRKGLQAADLGHRILREKVAFEECLHSFETVPEARVVLDISLLRRCLRELEATVNFETTGHSQAILIRGINVGLLLQRMAYS